MSEFVSYIDADMRMVWANRAVCKTVGKTTEQIAGLHCYQTRYNRDHPCPGCLVARAFKTGRPQRGEMAFAKGKVWSIQANPVKDHSGRVTGVLEIASDTTERRRAEQKLARRSALLRAMNRVFEEALTCESEQAVAQTCLEVAQQLADSKFGFIGEVNEAGRFDTLAMSDPGWQACRMPGSNAAAAIRNMEVRGIWGNVVKSGRPLIVNNPGSHPDRVGTPEGHPQITTFLGVPLKLGDKTIGMIAVANKEPGYNLADQQDLESLSVAFVEALKRKRAEEALRRSEERLRAVVTSAPVILFAVDSQGVLTMFEGKGLETLGLKPGEAVGRSIFDLFRGIPDLQAKLHRVLAGEAFTTIAEVAGSTFETHCAPLGSRNGRISDAIGVAIDVTERKRMEDSLRESEARYRYIFENIQDIFYRTDAQGIVTEISPSLERYGYTREGLLGTQVLDIYENPEERARLLEKLFERGEVFDYEVGLKAADGRVVPTSVNTRLLRDEDGAFVGVEGSLRDIGERKRMEEALREGEQRLRAVVTGAPVILFAIDSRGVITLAEGRGLEELGVRPDDVVGHRISDVFGHRPDVAEKLRHALAGETFTTEVELGGLTFEGHCAPLLDRNGNASGMIGVASDISDRKRMEKALRESEAKYRQIFDNMGDIYYQTDARGIITEISPSAERYGYTREGLIGTSVLDVYQDPDERSRLLQALFERGEVIDYEVSLKTGDGRISPTSVTTRLLRDDNGAFLGVEGVLRDMSERKRWEEALRQSETKYRQIFENVQDVFYRTDLEGVIREVSPSVERYGYRREELIGRPAQHLYVRAEERARLVKTLLEQGAVSDYEVQIKASGGREVVMSLSGRVLRGPGGAPLGFEGFLRDITERTQMEAALREQVRRDLLTGVLNHGAIVDELRSLISSGEEGSTHAVLMADVDSLKATNDTFGHPTGDAMLIAVAEALSQDGALVGRYGGDEFVAIIPGADRERAEHYRNRVTAALKRASLHDPDSGAKVPVEASIGVAIYPTESTRIEELIRRADTEMMAAKRQRSAASARVAASRFLGGGRTAQIVGGLVPLLTSTGDLDTKLQLVAHRLSVEAGYEGVTFSLFAGPGDSPLAQNTFAQAPDDLLEVWKAENRLAQEHPIRSVLEARRRPIILGDLEKTNLLTPVERDMLQAAGFRSAMVAPMMWEDQVVGLLGVAGKRKSAFGPRDASFLMTVATQVTAIARMSSLVENLQLASARVAEAQTETVLLLAAAAEAHDQTTGLHLQNVRVITEALAQELGHCEKAASDWGLAAVLHDIGKISVPDVVLSTAGHLTDAEWELMKQHTVWGAEFLADRPGFEQAAAIARSHHERWDGSGYPDCLAATDIPEAATIVAVADAFDAMTSDRPYREARSVAAAVREIMACSGTQFSPDVVQALVRLHKSKRMPRLQRQSLHQAAA